MDSEQKQFLSLTITPARFSPEHAAWILGFQPHEIPILVTAGLLKPLGSPPDNGQKFFAATAIEELSKDTRWLGRASDAIHRHWKEKNARKRPTGRTGKAHANLSSETAA